MDLDVFHTFLTLARIGHMTRAAAELHLTQPAVSAQLARLEDELGHRLFDRTPKGMVLTEAGTIFRAHAEDALSTVRAGREALSQLAGLQRGKLAIGGGATATTYLLPEILGRFHAHHPNIQLFVREQGSQSVVEAVWTGELDLGVVTLPVTTPQPGATEHMTIEPWITDDLRLLVPPGHPLMGRRRFKWPALDGEPLVLFEAGSAVRALLDRRIAEAQIHPSIVMELRSIESIKQMVAQGIGAAFVSEFALTDAEHSLASATDDLTRQLAIIFRHDRTMSTAAAAFLALMRASVG